MIPNLREQKIHRKRILVLLVKFVQTSGNTKLSADISLPFTEILFTSALELALQFGHQNFFYFIYFYIRANAIR